jgi:hypothetical protein
LGKALVNEYLPTYPGVELHGSPMHSGHKEWRGVPQNIRENIIMEVLQIIASDRSIRLFASVIAKSVTPNIDISGDLFTQVASRFDIAEL